jgi:hypothetical protein
MQLRKIFCSFRLNDPIARTDCTTRCGKVIESCALDLAIRGKNPSDARRSGFAGRGACYPPLGAAYAHTGEFRDAYQVENQREYRDSVAAKSGRHPLYRTPLRRKLQHPFSFCSSALERARR